MSVHNLSMKGEILELVAARTKTVEVRVGDSRIRKVQPDDAIVFESRAQWAKVRVLAVRRYSSFEHMLRFEDHERILPGKGGDLLLGVLREMMGDKDRRLMVYVFDIELIGARKQ